MDQRRHVWVRLACKIRSNRRERESDHDDQHLPQAVPPGVLPPMSRQGKSATAATFLASVPLFGEVARETISRVAAAAVPVDVPRGSVLFRRGEPCTGLYVIVSGQIKLALQATRGGEKVIEILGPGQSFGEAAMFLQKPHAFAAEALANTRVLHIAGKAVLAEIDHDPRFARRVISSLCLSLHQLLGELESCTLRSGTQRVTGYLLRLAGESGTGGAHAKLPAKKNIIASRLTLTQEHFSRILHELVTAGLIEMDGSAIRITDRGRLRSFSG